MNKVTREHLAGLELAMQRLNRHLAPENQKALNGLIAQASAAPEQGPVYQVCDETSNWIDVSLEKFESCLNKPGGWQRRTLYTHPSAEIDRLRAEIKRLDLALAQADHDYDCDRQQFEQKLAEAQALLRNPNQRMLRAGARAVMRTYTSSANARFSNDDLRIASAVFSAMAEAFLSATAQHAECKHINTERCQTGDSTAVGFCNDCGKNTHVGQPAEVKS